MGMWRIKILYLLRKVKGRKMLFENMRDFYGYK